MARRPHVNVNVNINTRRPALDPECVLADIMAHGDSTAPQCAKRIGIANIRHALATLERRGDIIRKGVVPSKSGPPAAVFGIAKAERPARGGTTTARAVKIDNDAALPTSIKLPRLDNVTRVLADITAAPMSLTADVAHRLGTSTQSVRDAMRTLIAQGRAHTLSCPRSGDAFGYESRHCPGPEPKNGTPTRSIRSLIETYLAAHPWSTGAEIGHGLAAIGPAPTLDTVRCCAARLAKRGLLQQHGSTGGAKYALRTATHPAKPPVVPAAAPAPAPVRAALAKRAVEHLIKLTPAEISAFHVTYQNTGATWRMVAAIAARKHGWTAEHIADTFGQPHSEIAVWNERTPMHVVRPLAELMGLAFVTVSADEAYLVERSALAGIPKITA